MPSQSSQHPHTTGKGKTLISDNNYRHKQAQHCILRACHYPHTHKRRPQPCHTRAQTCLNMHELCLSADSLTQALKAGTPANPATHPGLAFLLPVLQFQCCSFLNSKGFIALQSGRFHFPNVFFPLPGPCKSCSIASSCNTHPDLHEKLLVRKEAEPPPSMHKKGCRGVDTVQNQLITIKLGPAFALRNHGIHVKIFSTSSLLFMDCKRT